MGKNLIIKGSYSKTTRFILVIYTKCIYRRFKSDSARLRRQLNWVKQYKKRALFFIMGSSAIGRAAVSKIAGYGIVPHLPRQCRSLLEFVAALTLNQQNIRASGVREATTDLKSVEPSSCGFESRLAHHFNNKRSV